jgi:hypothetical protein
LAISRKYLNCSSETNFAVTVHVEIAEKVWEEWECCLNVNTRTNRQVVVKEGKTIPVQLWTGPEVSRSLRPSDFKTIGT